jgi:hypothetical protein
LRQFSDSLRLKGCWEMAQRGHAHQQLVHGICRACAVGNFAGADGRGEEQQEREERLLRQRAMR